MLNRQSLLAVALGLALLGAAPAPTTSITRPATTTQPRIPKDAVEFNGHFYKAFEADLSWHEKKKRCEEMGGHLAVIETAEEQKFIARLAKGRYLSLGATDEHKEGDWRWVNGAPWKYTCWMAGQPNNYSGEEHYLATYDEGEWVDVAAEGSDFWMPTGFICEWAP